MALFPLQENLETRLTSCSVGPRHYAQLLQFSITDQRKNDDDTIIANKTIVSMFTITKGAWGRG